MTLKDQIIVDMTAAMKAKDSARTSTLRMLKAAMVNRRIEKGSELDDERTDEAPANAGQTAARFDRAISQRRSPGPGRQRNGRDRSPRNVSAAGRLTGRIEQAVAAAMAETGATSMKEMGP